MRYVLFHCLDESLEVDPADDSDVPGSPAAVAQDAWDDEMQARRVMLSGVRLAPAAVGAGR